MQVPHGPDDRYCPFWRQKMSKVCHTCSLWTLLRGKNPQTEEMIERWDCSLAHLPTLMLEAAQQSRQAGASTDKVANEVRAFHEKMEDMNLKTLRLEGGRGKLMLEG